MASSEAYIESLLLMVEPLGVARARKMFGDWMIYIDEKPAVLICDNIAYIKMLPAIEPLMADAETGFPYDGAKLHYILNTDRPQEALAALKALLPLLPYPKKRKTTKG